MKGIKLPQLPILCCPRAPHAHVSIPFHAHVHVCIALHSISCLLFFKSSTCFYFVTTLPSTTLGAFARSTSLNTSYFRLYLELFHSIAPRAFARSIFFSTSSMAFFCVHLYGLSLRTSVLHSTALLLPELLLGVYTIHLILSYTRLYSHGFILIQSLLSSQLSITSLQHLPVCHQSLFASCYLNPLVALKSTQIQGGRRRCYVSVKTDATRFGTQIHPQMYPTLELYNCGVRLTPSQRVLRALMSL